jgi:hypothetical protein
VCYSYSRNCDLWTKPSLQVFLFYIRVLFVHICFRIVVGEFGVWLYKVVGGDVKAYVTFALK